MGDAIRLELGGQVTLTAARQDDERRRLRLSVYGGIAGETRSATVEVLLYRGEARELVIELLRRLKGGDDVARLTVVPGAIALDRLVDLVCGETVTPAHAGQGGGAPT